MGLAISRLSTLQLAIDVGQRCSWASGVVGVVDRWSSGAASHSSVDDAIAQTATVDVTYIVSERALQIAADIGSGT